MLMNAKAIQRSIDGATSQTALGKLLAAELKDEQRITELYLRCLGRAPTEAERAEYASGLGRLAEAFAWEEN